jgi:hypothetical protein
VQKSDFEQKGRQHPLTNHGAPRQFSQFLQEKVGLVSPMNKNLTSLLDDTLRDSRWDMPYLGMQVLIEGLALAAFGVLRDLSLPDSLTKAVLAYVMQD